MTRAAVLRIPAALLFLFALQAVPARGEVEWTSLGTASLGKKPLDVATDAAGKTLFVLVPGEVLVYSADGRTLLGRVPVDAGVSRIAAAPRGDKIYLTDQKSRSVRVVRVDRVVRIEVDDSPFRGPARAPVTVVVFSDYQ